LLRDIDGLAQALERRRIVLFTREAIETFHDEGYI
jgi:hypothetical protein